MATESSSNDLCDEPLEVVVTEEAVILIGPDGIALAMTPSAAAVSAERLRQAVDRVNGEGRIG
jgi:hypothetical protein